MTTATRTIRIVIDSSGATPQINQIQNQTERATFSVNKLAAAIASALAVAQLKDYSDAWIQIQNQLGRTSQSTTDLANTTATLLDVANQTRQGLQSTVDLYGTLRMSTEKLGYSQAEAVSMTKTINQLLLVGGKTAAQTAGAMYQLSQGLQAGALRGDEFNSVAEGAPDIMRALQKELGLTQGELREFAATGGITSEILAKAITSYAEFADQAAKNTKATFEQNAAVAKNNAIAWVGASDLIIKANQTAGESLVFLSQNIEKLVTIAGIAAGIYVARLIPAMLASASAMGAGVAATYAATLETIRYNTVLANLAVNATIAQRATLGLTNAAVAARGAMSVLFGPVGLILAGVAALAYLASGADEASDRIKDLTDATDGLTRAQLALKQQDLEDEVRKENNALTEQKNRLKELEELKERAYGQQSISIDGNVTEGKLNEELLKKRLEQIKRANIEIDVQREKVDKLTESLKKVNAEYAKDDAQRFGDTLKNPDISTPEGPNVGRDLGEGEAARERLRQDQDLKDKQRQEDAVRAKEWTSKELAEASSVTDSMRLELSTRQQVSQFYRDAEAAGAQGSYEREFALNNARRSEEIALADQRFAEDKQKRLDQMNEALAETTLDEDQKKAIKDSYREQGIVANDIYNETIAAANEAAAERQRRLDEAERDRKIKLGFDIASSGIAILQAFGSKSSKVQKTLAKASIAIDTAQGVAAGVKLGWPAGIPAVAWAIANGKKAMDSLNSAGSTPTAVAATAVPSLPTTATSNSEPAFKQKEVIEVRGITADSLITGAQLVEILSKNDTVVVALTNAQTDAQRRGVI
jgi:tape measure domain-containing protein